MKNMNTMEFVGCLFDQPTANNDLESETKAKETKPVEVSRTRDSWEAVHTEKSEFLDELKEIAEDSAWTQELGKSMRIVPVEESSVAENIPVMEDTLRHTRLAVRLPEGDQAIRGSAKTGLDAALGTALASLRMGSDTDRDLYCRVANMLLHSMGKRKLAVLKRHGKVTALQSERYADICPNEFFSESLELLEDLFGEVTFVAGAVGQGASWAHFELPDAVKVLEVGGVPTPVTPGVQIYTADVGTSAATIRPLVRLNGDRPIAFSSPFKIVHKGNQANWKKNVKELESSLHAGFQKALERLDWLVQMELRYPVAAMFRAAQKAHIPAAVYRPCADVLEYDLASGELEDDVTAYDIILRLAHRWEEYSGAKDAKKGGASSLNRRLTQDDTLGRLALLNWEELDLPAGIEGEQ